MVGQNQGVTNPVEPYPVSRPGIVPIGNGKYIIAGEGEVLLEGIGPGKKVPGSVVMTERGLLVARGGMVFKVFGKLMTANDLISATVESSRKGSSEPLQREMLKQAGAWGGGIAVGKLAAGGTVILGISGGPVGIVVVIVGGVGGSILGYNLGDKAGDLLSPKYPNARPGPGLPERDDGSQREPALLSPGVLNPLYRGPA